MWPRAFTNTGWSTSPSRSSKCSASRAPRVIGKPRGTASAKQSHSKIFLTFNSKSPNCFECGERPLTKRGIVTSKWRLITLAVGCPTNGAIWTCRRALLGFSAARTDPLRSRCRRQRRAGRLRWCERLRRGLARHGYRWPERLSADGNRRHSEPGRRQPERRRSRRYATERSRPHRGPARRQFSVSAESAELALQLPDVQKRRRARRLRLVESANGHVRRRGRPPARQAH